MNSPTPLQFLKKNVGVVRTIQDPPTYALSCHKESPHAKFRRLIRDGQMRVNVECLLTSEMGEFCDFLGKAPDVKSIFVISESKTILIMNSRRFSHSQANVREKPITARVGHTISPGPEKKLQESRRTQQTRKLRILMLGLKNCMGTTETLLQLTLYKIPLDYEMITNLSDGIKKNKSVSILRLTSCTFSTNEGFNKLADALCVNDTIEVLELYDNSLNDTCGPAMKAVICSHAKRQNEQIWIHGLRTIMKTHESSRKGLSWLNMSKNELGDEFIAKIIPTLNFDQFLRRIDLADNQINSHGVNLLIKLLRTSHNITCLDLRNNPGYSSQAHAKVVSLLKRNIKRLTEEEYSNSLQKHLINQGLFDTGCQTQGPARSRNKSRIFLSAEPISLEHKKDFITKAEKTRPAPKCAQCKKLFIELMRAEKKSIGLALENKKLRKGQAVSQEISLVPSNLAEGAIDLPKDPEELKARIDGLMTELNRLMNAFDYAVRLKDKEM